MQSVNRPSYALLLMFWCYGVVCGLGIASTAVGMMRGETLPGVIWPALTPLLVGPLLIMNAMGRKTVASTKDAA